LALASALAMSATGSALAQGYGSAAQIQTLPAGSVLKVKLNQRLNSEQCRAGDRFTATVQSDDDRSGLPEGTWVEGVVRSAKAAEKDKPGVLDVDFTGLRLPDGRVYAVNGSLTSLDSKSVTRDDSGRLVSKRASKNERMKFLGYGAGAGAAIGLLTGNDVLKTTLLGAAGGFLYGEATKDKDQGQYRDVDLKKGSEFGVRLDQRFAYNPVALASRDTRYGEPVGYRNPGQYLPQNRPQTQPAIACFVDDREVGFGAAKPFRAGKTTFVPAMAVLNALDAQPKYNQASRELVVRTHRGVSRLTVGKPIVWVYGKRVRLAAPAQIVKGTLCIPEQFVARVTGFRAEWDEGSRTLMFTRGANAPARAAAREQNGNWGAGL
jgi:hypothetical protein